MDAMEMMLTRKSIKKYKTDPVPKELIEQVIAAGLNAPSGLNKQSPIILAVTDRQVRVEQPYVARYFSISPFRLGTTWLFASY